MSVKVDMIYSIDSSINRNFDIFFVIIDNISSIYRNCTHFSAPISVKSWKIQIF